MEQSKKNYAHPILFLFFFSMLRLAGQDLQRTEILDNRQGLSQNFVACLVQDREGFLWAGTKNGLNRYDGRTFKVWTNDPENPNSLANDWVWTLDQHEDFLLVGTDGGGMDFFDRRHERFFHLPRPPELDGVVMKIQLAPSKKQIWLLAGGGTGNTNFFRLDLPDDFWQKLSAGNSTVLQQIKSRPLAPNIFQNFSFADQNKTIWGLSGSEFVQFDAETCAEIRRFSATADFTGWTQIPFVEASDDFWCLRDGRVFWFDGRAWESRKTQFSILARHVGFDWQNRFLLYDSGQLLAFDLKKIRENTSTLAPADADWQCTAAGQPTGFLLDRSGIFWYGTNAGGIQKINPRRQSFRHFFPGSSVYATPFEDSDGSKGYFEFGKGFVFSSKNPTGVVARFAQKLHEKNIFVRILRTNDGAYWLLTTSWETCKLVKILPDGNSKMYPFELQCKQPGNFFLDQSGTIWIASSGTLLRFDAASEQFQKFDYRAALPIEHEVYSLAKTAGEVLWLGTSQGLVKCQAVTGGFQFSNLKNENGNPNSLRKNPVAALLTDPTDESVLWIGTKGGGLTRFDTKSGKMRHFTTRDGLPDEVIYGVLPDEKGNFWLSSNKGIIRFTPATGKIRNFTEADGVQGDEFNTWAFAKTASGKLLFGGLNGLNELDPANFSENPNLPSVFLTGLKINNRAVGAGDSTRILNQNLEFLEKIELPFSQNSLSLTFSALEFTAPSKNRFRYFLENAEPAWAHETTENTANYLNLAPGTYIFKVMAANSDGVWNPQPASLKIVVLPPWWSSWWAYIFYAIGLMAAVRWLHRFQLRRRLEHAENERLKELDSFKSRLYANITHEFRTPLTVILGNTDLLEKATPTNPKLEAVRRNAKRLLTLVNQILDLSKVENKALHLEIRQSDVVAFLKYLVESFQSFANSKNQALRFSSDFAELQMDFDAERLNQVVTNLISNALKFTPAGGQIVVKLAKLAADTIEISVADTGIGIAQEDLPQVFDRFFQAKNQHQNKAGGTGIGLALTKELVKLFGGEIGVASEVGRGTIFRVKIPVTKNAPPAEWQTPAQISDPSPLLMPPPTKAVRVIGEDTNNGKGNWQPNEPNSKPQNSKLLIVEDNPDVVAYLQAILSKKFQISVAFNGLAGLEMAFAETPDLVLSDLMMPEKDGLEVCAELKNDPRTSHIPVVLLTAKAAVEDRVVGLSRGADAYLAKPFHEAELLATLENLLAARRRMQVFYSKIAIENTPESAPVPSAETAPEEQFLRNLRQFIEGNLQNSQIALDDLCRAAGMGKSNLSAKLTALTGLSPMIFLRNLRLARARDLLSMGGKNVSEVAFEVGFEDPKYFSRVFSEEFGVPPSEFAGLKKMVGGGNRLEV